MDVKKIAKQCAKEAAKQLCKPRTIIGIGCLIVKYGFGISLPSDIYNEFKKHI